MNNRSRSRLGCILALRLPLIRVVRDGAATFIAITGEAASN